MTTPTGPATPPPPPPIPPAAGGAAAAIHAAVQTVMVDAVADGYVIGTQSAIAMLERVDAHWDGWTPGDPEAARRILGDNGMGAGLTDMLATSRVRLTGIAEERFAEFAQVLAAGVARGASVEELARELRDFLDNPTWAYITAQQEIARAVSAATMDTYEDNGIAQHEWLVSGEDPGGRVYVCPYCRRNAAAGPVDVGEEFPTGDIAPPGHPRCRCALRPVIDLDGIEDFMDPAEAYSPGFTEAGDPADARWQALDEADRNELRDWWLRPDGGLHKWSTFTDLHKHLRKHVPDGFARRLAATIYHLRYGVWPGAHDREQREAAAPYGWEWSVEEARYVRTAAGAKRFGQPIGSEIKRRGNKDGWHDDEQRAKRQAYYARARKRAQDRHAAKQAAKASQTGDGHPVRKHDKFMLGDRPVIVTTDPKDGKVRVLPTGGDDPVTVDTTELRKGDISAKNPGKVWTSTNGEVKAARKLFYDPDADNPHDTADERGAGYSTGRLDVHDVATTLAEIDLAIDGATSTEKRGLRSLRAKVLALHVKDDDDPKPEPKPTPKPQPKPEPKDDSSGEDDDKYAARAKAFRAYVKGMTVSVEPGKGGKLKYTVRLADGTEWATRSSDNGYSAIRLTMSPTPHTAEGRPILSFHRRLDLAAKGDSHWRGLPYHVVPIDGRDNAKDDGSKGGKPGDGDSSKATPDDKATPDTTGKDTPGPKVDPAKAAADREKRVEQAIPELQKALDEIGPGGVRDKLAELYPNATDRDLDLAKRQVIRSLIDWGKPTAGMSEPGRGAKLAVRALDRQHGAGDHRAAVEDAKARLGDPKRFALRGDTGESLDVDDTGRLTEDAMGRLDALRDAGAALNGEIARRVAAVEGDLPVRLAAWRERDGEAQAATAALRSTMNQAWRDRFGEDMPIVLHNTIRNQPDYEMADGTGRANGFTPEQTALFNELSTQHRERARQLQLQREQVARVKSNLAAREAEVAAKVADIRREVLGETRKMGLGDGAPLFRVDPTMSKKRQAAVSGMLGWAADSAFPTEWQDQALRVYPYGVNAKAKRKRAYFSSSDGGFIDVGTADVGDERLWRSIVTHEATHAYERARPHLKAAEWLYLRYRTSRSAPDRAGRHLDYTSTITKGEDGYKDDFANHYTGRVYGDGGRQMPFEILSTGMETMLGGGAEYTDPDMEHFLLGVLALL